MLDAAGTSREQNGQVGMEAEGRETIGRVHQYERDATNGTPVRRYGAVHSLAGPCFRTAFVACLTLRSWSVPLASPSMLRGILAVLGAYVAIALVVMVGTAVATISLVPGGLAAMRASANGTPLPAPSAAYLGVNLVISLLAALLGGWIVMRFSPAPGLQWAVILAVLLLVLSAALGSRGPQGGQPNWYPYVIALVGAAGVMAGASLYPR